jgi:hypothetical protein
MIKRKIIGLFLILVFTIPVLPVLQVGELLGSNMLTEEISHSHTDTPVKLSEKEIHSIFSFLSVDNGVRCEQKVEMDERFISRQVDDVQTPPPNM